MSFSEHSIDKPSKFLRSKTHEYSNTNLFEVKLERSASTTLKELTQEQLKKILLVQHKPCTFCHIWKYSKLIGLKLFKWFKIVVYVLMIMASAFTFARRAGKIVEGAINSPIIKPIHFLYLCRTGILLPERSSCYIYETLEQFWITLQLSLHSLGTWLSFLFWSAPMLGNYLSG